MKVKDIKSTKDFLGFLSTHKNFIDLQDEAYNRTICGTGFDSEVLYILPSTKDLDNLKHYSNLQFVTINNYKIDKKRLDILKRNQEYLQDVRFLYIWNIKQDDLVLLGLFPRVTHLLISYIRKADFSFSGLDNLFDLETLVLISANKIADFNFLNTSQKEKIKHLHITYSAALRCLDGIEGFKSLETLSLAASTAESRKTVALERIDGIEELSNLSSFEMSYFKVDIEVLHDKLKKLPRLKQYTLNNQVYTLD